MVRSQMHMLAFVTLLPRHVHHTDGPPINPAIPIPCLQLSIKIKIKIKTSYSGFHPDHPPLPTMAAD